MDILKENTGLNAAMCGLGAGLIEGALILTPMETMRVQLIHDKIKHGANPKYKTIFHGMY